MSDKDQQRRDDFQRRRRTWLIWQAASMSLVLGGAGLGALFEEKLPMWIWLAIIGLGTIGLYFASPAVNFRCPRCENYVGRGDGPLDPRACTDCGFLFK